MTIPKFILLSLATISISLKYLYSEIYKEDPGRNHHHEKLLYEIESKNEKGILDIISKNKGYLSWHVDKLSFFLKEEASSYLRRELIYLFYNMIYDQKDEKGSYTKTITKITTILVTRELSLLSKKKNHSLKEKELIAKILTIIKEHALKSTFYHIVPYIAYPLVNIRKLAFQALASWKDDRLFPFLIKLIKSKNAIERIYALDALYYIKDKRVIHLILKLIRDPNKSVRYYAIRTLNRLNSQEAISFFIMTANSDKNTEVRKASIEILSNLRSTEVFNVFIKGLSDPDVGIRKVSLEALNKYKNPKACYYISIQLKQEENDDLKIMQIKTLLSFKNSGGMLGLNKIMNKEENPFIRSWAIYATGMLKDFRGFQELIKNLEHENENIRAEAANSLGKFKDKRASKPLLARLMDEKESYYVQSSSLFSLREIQHDSILPDLFDLSEKHSNIYLRIQLKNALHYLLHQRF